jgi:hypothetical protein
LAGFIGFFAALLAVLLRGDIYDGSAALSISSAINVKFFSFIKIILNVI